MTAGKWMKARYRGTCWCCKKQIQPGESMFYQFEGRILVCQPCQMNIQYQRERAALKGTTA